VEHVAGVHKVDTIMRHWISTKQVAAARGGAFIEHEWRLSEKKQVYVCIFLEVELLCTTPSKDHANWG
jgi:hypothetical protein